MEFEWDAAKDKRNLVKHGLSFAEATLVFLDHSRIETHDANTAHKEDRWLTVGLVDGVELAVVYTMRDESTRIISARKAESHERYAYWQNR
jgi:uncharacterized protein